MQTTIVQCKGQILYIKLYINYNLEINNSIINYQ